MSFLGWLGSGLLSSSARTSNFLPTKVLGPLVSVAAASSYAAASSSDVSGGNIGTVAFLTASAMFLLSAISFFPKKIAGAVKSVKSIKDVANGANANELGSTGDSEFSGDGGGGSSNSSGIEYYDEYGDISTGINRNNMNSNNSTTIDVSASDPFASSDIALEALQHGDMITEFMSYDEDNPYRLVNSSLGYQFDVVVGDGFGGSDNISTTYDPLQAVSNPGSNPGSKPITRSNSQNNFNLMAPPGSKLSVSIAAPSGALDTAALSLAADGGNAWTRNRANSSNKN